MAIYISDIAVIHIYYAVQPVLNRLDNVINIGGALATKVDKS